MTITLTTRAGKGSALNATEHDTNLTAIQTAANAFSSTNGQIMVVENITYTLELKAPTAYTINSLTAKSASGSCTAAVQIDGVNVTGLSAVGVTTSEGETTASAANTVAVGNTVDLVISANSACLNLRFTLKVTP